MMSISRRRRTAGAPWVALVLTALLTHPVLPAAQDQQPQQSGQDQLTFGIETTVSIVSVDVVVRDSSGNVVRGLTAKDFTVTEDGKPQVVETFSFQEIETGPVSSTDQIALLDGLETKLREEVQRAASAESTSTATIDAAATEALRNRRMLVLLFDVSSMQPEDVQRAVDSGREYLDQEISPADLVAVVTIGSRLNVLTDFTSSREDLQAALQSLSYENGTEIDFEAVATAATDTEAATSEAATSEASVFEEFNNDVRLRALKTLCETLTPIQQKKAVLYFSAGMRRGGDDNGIELRAATNTCNRGNTSIYPVDSRGLQAVVAGGGASSRGGRGTSLFTGANATRGFSQLSGSQETLTTLAADTGGRAFTDTNDLGEAFSRVQNDLAAYYLLGYSSTNPARDGRFRRIQVRVNRPDLRGLNIEARNGYYAGRSFENTNRRDREAQLDEQLNAAISSTDVPMVLGTGWFRQQKDRFYVPIVVAMPGSVIPVAAGADKVSIDVRGRVFDEQNRTVATIRDTIEVPSDGNDTLVGKQVVYQSGVTLPQGAFWVKVVARENTGGAIGSFEARIVIPQATDKTMRVSSVVMSTQMQPAKASGDNPLIRDGVQLLPNLTRVVTRNQRVFFFYEVYDPALDGQNPHLRTNLTFYRGGVKVFDTPMVERTAIDDSGRRAVVFRFEVPANQFTPGEYTTQINVIDTVASQASFPRMNFVVLE